MADSPLRAGLRDGLGVAAPASCATRCMKPPGPQAPGSGEVGVAGEGICTMCRDLAEELTVAEPPCCSDVATYCTT